MKRRVVNLKEGEILAVMVDGVAHALVMRSADGEWLNIRTHAVKLGVAADTRAADEIDRALPLISEAA